MKYQNEIYKANLGEAMRAYKDSEKIQVRDELMKRFGVGKKLKNVPLTIQNGYGTWLNPYFIARLSSDQGLPKEMSIELTANRAELADPEDWWDGRIDDFDWEKEFPKWCDFWFYSFTKIPHNVLCDSKKYYQTLRS